MMAHHKASITWDDQKHTTVHLGMTNHDGDSDAAYLRKCVEFFEMNRAGLSQQLILERLAAIERLLKNGVQPQAEPQTHQTDDLFDDLLEQLE